jgi:osmotically-inducible protein OsmY
VIKENIAKALQRRANLEATGIQIEIQGDQVILKGKVHSWNERTEAAHAAWAAPGVSTVDDQIVIDYD